VSELKPIQLRLLEPPSRTVKDIVADGFKERQWLRNQKREAGKKKARAYAARKRAEEKALAAKRNSAASSSPADERGKLPRAKSVGGGQ
jgi:hypothetical protein